MNDSQVSVSIVDLATGAVLFERNATAPMAPASNMKILSTGAALQRLGADFQFQTRLFLQTDSTRTRLVVAGSGDPAFGDRELLRDHSWIDESGQLHRGISTGELLELWTDAVRASGVKRVDELVVDARIFEPSGFHAGWPEDQASSPFCAEVWGLNFRTNTVDVYPRGSGASADIGSLDPPYDWLSRRRSPTSKKSAARDFWVGRTPGSNELVIGGGRVANPKNALSLTVRETPSLFAELLSRRLRASGVEVLSARTALATDAAPGGTPLGCVFQTPISVVLTRANTDSQNLYAESLLKRLGAAAANRGGERPDALPGPSFAPGSWQNGTQAMRAIVASRIGEDTVSQWILADGSGLARESRVTAEGLALWLRSFALDATLGPTYFASFAVAGSTGTVASRFASLERSAVRVECKTGFIRGVSCLSGRVVAPDGRQFLFSVLNNNLGGDIGPARTLQEQIVLRLVRELEPARQANSRHAGSSRG